MGVAGRSSGSDWKRQKQRTAAWEAAERKRHAKEMERQAQQDYLAEQQERAASLTREAAERVAELTEILRAALDAKVAPLDLTAGKVTPDEPVLDLGAEAIAYDHDPVRGAKYVIQAKKYTHKVQPSAVRELHGTVQHEGANKGILVTTHGFTSGCHEWANGKPLQLYDGTHLLALCKQYGIEARIVLPRKPK